MAAKNAEQRRKEEIEAAIRSLYDLFPEPGYRKGKTKKTYDLLKKIAAREKELADDAKLRDLKEQLKTEQGHIVRYGKERRQEVDAILREFRLRGESGPLLSKIEKLAKAEPVVLFDEDCCD